MSNLSKYKHGGKVFRLRRLLRQISRRNSFENYVSDVLSRTVFGQNPKLTKQIFARGLPAVQHRKTSEEKENEKTTTPCNGRKHGTREKNILAMFFFKRRAKTITKPYIKQQLVATKFTYNN